MMTFTKQQGAFPVLKLVTVGLTPDLKKVT